MPESPAVADPTAALAPIVVDVVVPCPPHRAFDYFTRDIGRWWPLATHSLGEANAVDDCDPVQLVFALDPGRFLAA